MYPSLLIFLSFFLLACVFINLDLVHCTSTYKCEDETSLQLSCNLETVMIPPQKWAGSHISFCMLYYETFKGHPSIGFLLSVPKLAISPCSLLLLTGFHCAYSFSHALDYSSSLMAHNDGAKLGKFFWFHTFYIRTTDSWGHHLCGKQRTEAYLPWRSSYLLLWEGFQCFRFCSALIINNCQPLFV